MMNTIATNLNNAQAYISRHYTLKLMKVSAPHAYDNEYGEGHYELSAGDPKLEGTRGEHWSPKWPKIIKKYLLESGESINPEALPEDIWITIQTNPDREIRRGNSLTWAIDAALIASQPFQIGELTFDPALDMICMGGDENAPTLDWGVWPVKKEIFADTYEKLI